jgi:cytochrome c peroxidase
VLKLEVRNTEMSVEGYKMKRRALLVGDVSVGILGLVAIATTAGGCGFWCTDGSCGWSDEEKAELVSLSGLPATAPPDPSNKYVGDATAVSLGKMLFHDTRFSGPSTMLDALNRPMPYGRAQKGQPTVIACVSCHAPASGSVDASADPGNVSLGAGWGFSNTLPTINSAYYKIQMWNGRQDSLWGQALADNENVLSTNGNRLHTAWTLNDLYHDQYQAVFTDYPLPFTGPSSEWPPLVETDAAIAGQCKLVGGACPANCRAVTSTVAGAAGGCWPRFPLQGKPGKTAGCQTGSAGEPFGDAFDCMDADDQKTVTRILVNFGKAIASYEFTLVSNSSPFDRWITDLGAGKEDTSTAISIQAQQGARLFVGKAGCSDCHNTPLLSDSRFHNVAVEQSGPAIPTVSDCPAGGVCDCAPQTDTHAGPKNCLPWGAYDGVDKLQKNAFRRDGVWSDDPTDTSRMGYVAMTLNDRLIGEYRTPSLRNVAVTAPYMHTGGMATLAEVVTHYNDGGDPNTPGAPAAQLKPLYLDTVEQSALVEFLKSLTNDPLPSDLTDPPTLP